MSLLIPERDRSDVYLLFAQQFGSACAVGDAKALLSAMKAQGE